MERSNMKDKINYKIIIIVLVALFILIAIQCIPKTIDKNIQTVCYQNKDKSYQELINIEIEGRYYNRIFRNDIFKGQININSNNFISGGSLRTLEFEDGYSMLTYSIFNEVESGSVEDSWDIDVQPIGIVLTDSQFDSFSILFYDLESLKWSNETTKFLSYPSTTRDEAINILSGLAQKSEWLESLLKLQ